jgi:two-component system nitrate/nitrite response regulator NarL
MLRAIRGWPEFDLLGVTDGSELFDELVRLGPDVAVIDHGSLGLAVAPILEGALTQTRVIFLSEKHDPEGIFTALESGAVAYVLKTAGAQEVCHVIAAAARGDHVISPTVQAAVVARLHARNSPEGPALTRRERQVLGLIAEGLTVPQAARRLGLRPGTVRTHVEHLTSSLGVHGQKAAVAAAMRAGLLK